jgi:hypothetical protein
MKMRKIEIEINEEVYDELEKAYADTGLSVEDMLLNYVDIMGNLADENSDEYEDEYSTDFEGELDFDVPEDSPLSLDRDILISVVDDGFEGYELIDEYLFRKDDTIMQMEGFMDELFQDEEFVKELDKYKKSGEEMSEEEFVKHFEKFLGREKN